MGGEIVTELRATAMLGAAALLVIRMARLRVRSHTEWVVPRRVEWAVKRASLAACTPDDLLVITDFDATLTTGDSTQCHDLLGSSELMSDEFRTAFAPLLDWTTNAAIDGVEWWDEAHQLMVDHGMPPRALIPRLVREADMKVRPGTLDMLKRLELLSVPVLIVSAGVSDVIEEFLRQHGALSENVTICSNRLNYAADSAPQSVSPTPPITSFTKSYAYRSASAFFRQHADRRALIILGDSVTDVDPGKEVPYDACLSVGFLNDRPAIDQHAKAFDAVVLGNEGSLLPVSRHHSAVPSLSSRIVATRGSLRLP